MTDVQKIELQRASQGVLETESEELSQQMILLKQRLSEPKSSAQYALNNKSRIKNEEIFLSH